MTTRARQSVRGRNRLLTAGVLLAVSTALLGWGEPADTGGAGGEQLARASFPRQILDQPELTSTLCASLEEAGEAAAREAREARRDRLRNLDPDAKLPALAAIRAPARHSLQGEAALELPIFIVFPTTISERGPPSSPLR